MPGSSKWSPSLRFYNRLGQSQKVAAINGNDHFMYVVVIEVSTFAKKEFCIAACSLKS
jgi:hypothetical protein